VAKVKSPLGSLLTAIAGPVGYASDPKAYLSATPATPIGAVDGVGDRMWNLSMA
jgi:hypothetical protein